MKALTRGDLTVRALEKEIGDRRVARLVKALTADGLVEPAGRRVRLPARAHGHSRVVIRLSAAARSQARRARRGGRSARIRLEVVARDTAGNRVRLRRTLRLT